MGSYQSVFTPSCLEGLFPAEERTAAFFDALFGDAEDGAYDIRLTFQQRAEGAAEQLEFFFELHQRRGHVSGLQPDPWSPAGFPAASCHRSERLVRGHRPAGRLD